MENDQNTTLTSFFWGFLKILTKYTTFTSLYNGFVDLLIKYTSFTSLHNGFVDFEPWKDAQTLHVWWFWWFRMLSFDIDKPDLKKWSILSIEPDEAFETIFLLQSL